MTHEILHEILRDKLLVSAKTLGWLATIEPDFTSARFRGRLEASSVSLPQTTIGVRLGAYPVVIAPITLNSTKEMQTALQELHNQMVIARSYMRADEVINAHIMLCVTVINSKSDDCLGIIDLAERDETVCRKMVWMPDANALEASYDTFIARTFLAQPWQSLDAVLDAPLDHNTGLAERILVQHGLSVSAAKEWVELAETCKNDPTGMIPKLVSAWVKSQGETEPGQKLRERSQ